MKDENLFDLLFAVPGIAIGVTIVRFTQFFGHLIVYKTAKTYLRTPAVWLVVWSVGMLLLACQYWFFAIRAKGCFDISFAHFLLECVMPFSLSLISFVVCPNHDESGFKNLEHHFRQHAFLFYVLVGISLTSVTVENYFFPSVCVEPPYARQDITRVIAGSLYLFVSIVSWHYRSHQKVSDLLNTIVMAVTGLAASAYFYALWVSKAAN